MITTISVGLTMLAKCGLISEFRYSMSSRATCDHASFTSANTCFSSMWMTRVSVAVNSRPSIFAKRPLPPKKLSTTANTNFGSSTTRPVPRSGRILHEVQARRHVQRVHVLAELLHLDRRDRDFRRAAQHVEQAGAKQTREALVDHLERRHAAAHDAHLVREIVVARLARRGGVFGLDGAAVDAVQQGVDFVLA